jgi:predicted enzyme related to lactoylglutathione lyase
MTRNAINWLDIPATELDCAQRFYESVLATSLRREQLGEEQLAVFPYEQPGAGGCLHLASRPVAPSRDGTRVYLDASPSIDTALDRAVAAGGRIATPKVALSPVMGFFAHIEDSEGNVVGLHAMARDSA